MVIRRTADLGVLPSSLKEKAQAVRDRGGLGNMQNLLHVLTSLLQRNSERLKECESMLQDEEESDRKMSSKFGSNWVRRPSIKVNELLKTDLNIYKIIISTATSSDAIVKAKYEKHKEKIALLCLPDDKQISSLRSGNSSTVIDELTRSLVQEFGALRSETECLQGKLENAGNVTKPKFHVALSSDGLVIVNKYTLPFENLDGICDPIQQKVVENIYLQQRIASEIKNFNAAFSKANVSAAFRTKNMLRDLSSAYNAYMELTGNLEEGSKFHSNLTLVLVNFQNKIKDFCSDRKTERDKFIRDLQKNSSSVAKTPPTLQPSYNENITISGRPQPLQFRDSFRRVPPIWNSLSHFLQCHAFWMDQHGPWQSQPRLSRSTLLAYSDTYPVGSCDYYTRILKSTFSRYQGNQAQPRLFPYTSNIGFSYAHRQRPLPYPQ